MYCIACTPRVVDDSESYWNAEEAEMSDFSHVSWFETRQEAEDAIAEIPRKHAVAIYTLTPIP